MTIRPTWPLYLANAPIEPNLDLAVTDKYSGEVVAHVARATPAHIDLAIAAAVKAAGPMRRMPAYARQAVLDHCVMRFRERFDELAESLCVEAGKPINDARGEVTRLIDTFRYAAEESVRMNGEVLEMQISARAAGRRGMVKRVPVGPVSFISPFNFPLNLAAHKIAPALAVGCPFVLKPASRPPLEPCSSARSWPRPTSPKARSLSSRAAATARTCSPPTTASSCCRSPDRPTWAGRSRPKPGVSASS